MTTIVLDNFIGLNAWTDPGSLREGELTQADNVYVDAVRPYYTPFGPTGEKGGDLVSRPGKQGQIASGSTLPNPLVAPLAYLDASGDTTLLFGSGPVGGTAKLYSWAAGSSASPTEVKQGTGGASFALNTDGVRLVRLGNFVYCIDGSSGNVLWRTDTTSANTSAVRGMNPETAPPSVVLTNTSIDPMSAATASDWSGVTELSPTPYPITLVNPLFDNGGSSYATAGWSTSGTPDAGGNPTVPDGGFANYFDGGGGESLTQAFNCPALSWPSGAEGVPLYARIYKLAMLLSSYNAADTVVVTMAAYSGPVSAVGGVNTSTGSLLGSVTQNFQVPYNGGGAVSSWITQNLVFSFDSLGIDPQSITLTIASGATNHAGAGYGFSIYGYNPQVSALDGPLTISATSGSGLRISQGLSSAAGAPTGAGLYTNQNAIVRNFSASPLDLAAYGQIITFGYSAPAQSGQVAFRVGLQPPLSSDIYWTNPVIYSSDGTYFYVDTTTIPQSVLASVAYLYLQFLQDMPADSDLSDFCTIGPMTTAGNLSVGPAVGGGSYAPVFYVVTEIDDCGDATVVDIIESDWSPASASVQPTGLVAIAQVTLGSGAPVNASSATHYAFYRFGGVFTDGYGRLVATCPLGSDFAAGADSLARDQSNPYAAWNHTAKTLTDNTPDSFLMDAVVAEIGRSVPPTGAQAIAAWQGRVWLAAGSTIYASWLMQAGLENGLYFTEANLPNDPDAIIKGITFSVGAADNDPVQALVACGSGDGAYLVVLKQYSVWVVQGTDPTNFTCQQVTAQGSTVGCVAPRTACIVGGSQVWWLGADGVYAFSGGSAQLVSLPLVPLLDPQSPASPGAITPSVRALAAMFEWDKKVLLLMPTSGDSQNTVAYVYGTITQTWSRFTSFGFTGGVTLSAEADNGAVYLAGYDGQVYTLGGAIDMTSPTDPGTAITVAVTTKGIGQETPNASSFKTTRPTRYFLQAVSSASVSLTFGVVGDAYTYSKTHSFSAVDGESTIDIAVQSKIPPSCRGSLIYLSLSAPTTGLLRIRRVACDFAKGTTGR